MGAVFMPLTLIATTGLADADQGLASGLFNTSQQVGGALGLAVLSTLATSKTASAGGSPANQLVVGFHWAFAAGAVVMVVALGVMVALLRSRHVAKIEAAGGVRRAGDRRSLMSTVLRADAQRNLDRILEAAADAFAELGPEATIDEIARRAGVGHGTVFRHFPTKDGLRAAVLRVRLDELLVRAQELLEEPDAGAAFEELVWVAAASCRRDRFLFEGVETCVFEEVSDRKAELHEVFDRLIRRARRAGKVRRNVDARDVGALVGAAIQAAQHAERDEDWRRYVQVVLDGLRGV